MTVIPLNTCIVSRKGLAVLEILGMSIALAAVVATVLGVAARNIEGWLKSNGNFNIRHAAASAGVAFIVGLPLVIAAFSGAFAEVEAIAQEAQLMIFVLQIAAIAGIDALTKGGLKAAAKGK